MPATAIVLWGMVSLGIVTAMNETPTVRGLAANYDNKVYMETMILWNNHYNLNFNVGLSNNSKK